MIKYLAIIPIAFISFLGSMTFQADQITVDGNVKVLEGNVKIQVNGFEIEADKAIINQDKKEIFATAEPKGQIKLELNANDFLESDSIRFNYEHSTFTAYQISIDHKN